MTLSQRKIQSFYAKGSKEKKKTTDAIMFSFKNLSTVGTRR